MQEYDLWLDESGDFESAAQTDRSRSPSLAGGILMPSGALTDAEIRKLALPDEEEGGHAMEMDREEARRIVPAALEGVCRAGGRLIYFENTERIDYHTNRDLYFRVLAAGLAQLVRYLASLGAFRLNIVVAKRLVQEEDDPENLREITAEEYRRELKSYITAEFLDISFSLPAEDNIALTILSARREARLILADYACNAKLTIRSDKYKPVRDRLQTLFGAGLIFTVTALTAEERIRTKLASGDTAGALAEFFTTRGRMNREKMYREILAQLSSLSYRLQRLQIRSFTDMIHACVSRETDFERGEALLKIVTEQFFRDPLIGNLPVQTDESLFRLKLSLADMFLREGDVISAAPVISELSILIRGMNYRVENLAYLYGFREKLALYQINCMEYEAAMKTMEGTIRTMENVIAVLSADDLILSYFGQEDRMISEYLGDAYCMKVYAELFLQRRDPDLFEVSLKQDTEKALSQYSFSGELERNQQYRSKAENEAGNCLSALQWLLQTKADSLTGEDLVTDCVQYLEAAGREDPLSRLYYAMYYTEIMENAYRLGQKDLAENMYTAMKREKNTIRELIVTEKPARILSDTRQRCIVYQDIFSEDKHRRYHPQEILLWKYGNCLWCAGSKKAAEEAWSQAVSVCGENPDYTVLAPVSWAIMLDEAHFRLMDGEDIGSLRKDLLSRVKRFYQKESMPAEMRNYAERIQSILEKDKVRAEECLKLSREIAF